MSDQQQSADWLEGQIGTESATRTDLVCIHSAKPEEAPTYIRTRPQATFLAHLIAVSQRAPQTLDKRRAEPAHAISRYTDAQKTVPGKPGHALKRAV